MDRMENKHISESLHDFFKEAPRANVSDKADIKMNTETDYENTEMTSTEICDGVSKSTEEFEQLERMFAANSDLDAFPDEDNDLTISGDKDDIVIVQIDDGGPRPPRQSSSEVVIPLSPELSPPKSSSSGSSVYTSDYTDSEDEDGYQTPVFVIKAIVGSHMYEVSDDEEATSPAIRSVFNVRSDSVDGDGDGLPRVVDDADDRSNESDHESYSSDERSEYTEREMFFTHYRRANGQSIVEKVYLDIAKFVEEHADRLRKPRSRSVSSRGIRQSSSVTTALTHPGKISVTHRAKSANSAHCTVSTEKIQITTRREATIPSPTRKDEDTQTSPCDTDRSQSDSKSDNECRDSALSIRDSNVSCVSTANENDERGLDVLYATTDHETDGRSSKVSIHALSANTDSMTTSNNVDIKTKHYPILPDIGKGTPANIASQESAPHGCSPTTTLTSGVIPKTLSKSANMESKLGTNRKPGVPRQLKSVACYQDGRVSVSILGDQRMFGESEPPHLNITFVHRQEPPVKKPVTARDGPEPSINDMRDTDANDVTHKQSTRCGGQATSVSRKPLPPIRKCSKSGQQRKQNAPKVSKVAPKPSAQSHISRNAKRTLPPLKGVPKSNMPGRSLRREGKKPKTRPNHFNRDFGIPMPRKANDINWNIVQTRAQWPSFNTHLDPDASERHSKMITSIPV